MSRSRKKPIIKDTCWTELYWRPIRREWKQKLKSQLYNDDFYLRNPKEIINDYDYCDWWMLIQEDRPYWGNEEPLHWFGNTKEEVKRYTRK